MLECKVIHYRKRVKSKNSENKQAPCSENHAIRGEEKAWYLVYIQAACGRMQFTHWLVLPEGSLFYQQTGTCTPATKSWTPDHGHNIWSVLKTNSVIHVQILIFFSLANGDVLCQIISFLHSLVWFIVAIIWVVTLRDKVNVCSSKYTHVCSHIQYMTASCFSAVLQNSWSSTRLYAA